MRLPSLYITVIITIISTLLFYLYAFDVSKMIAEKVLVGMVTSDNNFVNFAGFTILQILVAIGKKSLISGVIFGFIISYIVHKLIRKKYDLDEI